MLIAALINFSTAMAMLLTALFRIGNVADALASPTGQPYIEILQTATQNIAATSILVAYMAIALLFCAINLVTTASRQLFAFARDEGTPYSAVFRKVRIFVSAKDYLLAHLEAGGCRFRELRFKENRKRWPARLHSSTLSPQNHVRSNSHPPLPR